MDLTIESFPVSTAQVLGYLVKSRGALGKSSKDSTDYVVVNQSALYAAKQFSKALRDAYRKAESASVAAKKRSDELEDLYRQARRLVRTKAQACEAQSSYVNFLIAQTMAMGKRGKSARLDSNREAQSMALVYHPIHAANSLADLRVEWRDAARENAEWMVRDTQAYDELSKLYHHAVDLQDALVALYAEWDAVGPKLRKWEDAQLGISANILFPLEWVMDDGEEDRVRVSRIHQALVREEKREVWELGWHGCLKKTE